MQKEEIDKITDMMYQNQKEEAFNWFSLHINELKNDLIEQMQRKSEDTAELALDIMQSMVKSYQNQRIIELADCLKYEYSKYMGWM